MSLDECLRLAEELSRAVYEAVKGCDCILLSGGVDTSFVAASAAKHGHRFRLAVTSAFRGGGGDVAYASLVASRLNIPHLVRPYGLEEALEASRLVVEALDTIDPVEVRCSVSLYVALRAAKEGGCRRVATGDGGDELFAGYPFLHDKPPWLVEEWTRRVVGEWRFSSVRLGEAVGLEVVPAYTARRVVELALRAPHRCKVALINGRVWGKVLLRLWLEGAGLSEVAWRDKEPIEVGSGSLHLAELWRSMVGDSDLEEALRDGFKPPSRSHLYLYKVYRGLGRRPPKAQAGERPCPICGGPLKGSSCRFCGAYVAEDGSVSVYTD